MRGADLPIPASGEGGGWGLGLSGEARIGASAEG